MQSLAEQLRHDVARRHGAVRRGRNGGAQLQVGGALRRAVGHADRQLEGERAGGVLRHVGLHEHVGQIARAGGTQAGEARFGGGLGALGDGGVEYHQRTTG